MMDSRRVPGLQPMTRTARADDPGQQDPGGSRQPGWLEPELATLTADRLSDPAWLFERKFDGERCLAFRAGQQLRLMTRNRQQVTSTYPETAGALRAQQASDFIARRRRCMPEKQRRRWREAMPRPSRCLDDRRGWPGPRRWRPRTGRPWAGGSSGRPQRRPAARPGRAGHAARLARVVVAAQPDLAPRLHLERRDEAGHEAQALIHPGQCSHQGRGPPPTVAGGRSGGRPCRPDAGGQGPGTPRSLRDPAFA